MSIEFSSVCKCPKNFKTAVEEEEGLEQLMVSVKLKGIFLTPEQLSVMLGYEVDFVARNMLDEAGCPIRRVKLCVPKDRTLEMTGGLVKVGGKTKAVIPAARVEKVSAMLNDPREEAKDEYANQPGAIVEMTLTWRARMDELNTLGAMLNHECALEACVTDGGQTDMFTKRSAGERQAADHVNDALKRASQPRKPNGDGAAP